MSEIERIISRLKNLKQYKDLSQEDLELMAKEQLDKNDILSSLTFCINDEEKEYANKLIEMYLAESSIESNSDKDTLKQLIDLEILVERIKSFLKTEFSKANPAIPTHMLQELRDTNAQIILMKEKLGLSKQDKSEDSGLTLFENLKKKALEYYKTHAGCNIVRCIAEGSKILMSDFSTKNIEEINVGDEIMAFDKTGWNGLKKAKVLNKTFSGIKDILEIEAASGNILGLTSDHLILVDYKHHTDRNWQRVGHEIDLLKNSSRHKIPILKNQIKDYENYYKGCLLGIIDSDGHTCKQKHIKWNFEERYYIWQSITKEYKAIEFILNKLNIQYKKNIELGNRSGFNKNYEGFNYYLSTKNASFIKKIKEQIQYDIDIKLGYLAGFIIGDGNVSKTGKISISQKPGDKSDYLENIIKSLDIKYRKYTDKKRNINTFRIYNGQFPFYFPESIKAKKYSEICTFTKRKYVDLVYFKLNNIKKNINVWDLTTSTETFIANGFYVHNCPECSKLFMLMMRTKDLDAKKATFFRNTILYNTKLFDLYHQKRITDEEIAEILGVSVLDVSYLYSNIYLKELNVA